MQVPTDVEVHDDPNSTWWIDKEGILCSISKKNYVQETREAQMKRMDDFIRITGGKKMCMLLDITYARPSRKEDRDEAAEILAKVVKAMAMVSRSPLGRMIANLFFGLKPPPYPVKMFSDEKEAREWLRQYL